ncbi:MAG: hypothetical protein AABW88_04870 [Nanoarchaeota archaeon]|mgnify:CR=1 FL=1
MSGYKEIVVMQKKIMREQKKHRKERPQDRSKVYSSAEDVLKVVGMKVIIPMSHTIRRLKRVKK